MRFIGNEVIGTMADNLSGRSQHREHGIKTGMEFSNVLQHILREDEIKESVNRGIKRLRKDFQVRAAHPQAFHDQVGQRLIMFDPLPPWLKSREVKPGSP